MAISDNLRGALYMNIAMFAFTVNDAFMKAATETMPLFQAILLRGAMTLPALVAIGLAFGGMTLRMSRKDGGIVALRTVAEIGGTILFLTALMQMPLANLSAIMQALPLLVTLAAALIFREPVGWKRMTAICIGFLGVLIVIRPGTEGFDGWSLVGLGSVLCVVARDLATRRLSRGIGSVSVALCAAVGVMAMGLVGTIQQGWQPVTGAEGLRVLAAAAMLVAGYMFSVMVMRVGEIGFVAPFRYTSLLWAILLGWLFFGTLPDSMTTLGAVIVVATGLFTLYRERHLGRLPVPAAPVDIPRDSPYTPPT